MIDTHTHLYLPEFTVTDSLGGDTAVKRALESGVSHMVFPNVDLTTISPMKSLASRYPEQISMGMGLHPTEVKEDWRDALDVIFTELSTTSYSAIGEVGIDLYWDSTFAKEQEEVFMLQMEIAKRDNLPVIIHCRSGLDVTLQCIERSGVSGKIPLIFHSFTGSESEVEHIRRVCSDAYFGINGVCTFKNAKDLRSAIPVIGIDRILLETDSPYLAPVPNRGRRNESSNLPYILACISSTLGIDKSEAERITDKSALKLFFTS